MYNSFTCHKIVFSTVRHKWVKTYVINVFFNKSNQFDLEVNGLVIDCNIVKTVDFYQGFVTKTMFLLKLVFITNQYFVLSSVSQSVHRILITVHKNSMKEVFLFVSIQM